MEKFDLVILGGGPGGYVPAIRAAQCGMKVALVEKDALGGTCLNRGCIPTKYLADIAHLVEKASGAASRGVVFGAPEIRMSEVMAGKKKIVSGLGGGIGHLLRKNGVEVVKGEGRVTPRRSIEVNGRELAGENIILATGSRPVRPSAFPPGDGRFITSDELLDLDRVPTSLAVVGAGFIGCEFASIFRSLGSEVSVFEMLPRLMPLEDQGVSATLEKSFRKRGIKVDTGRSVTVEELSGFEVVLVAVGRAPVLDGLGLEEAGVEIDEQGFIRTDSLMRTSVPEIFAVGDIAGQGQLAYLASEQGVSVVEGLNGRPCPVNRDLVPNCVFTWPEIGTFGKQVAPGEEGRYKVGSFPFAALGKAHCIGETEGYARVIADRETGRLLGAQVVGAGAADLVHIASLAAAAEGTLETLAEAVFGHPVLAESLKEAAAAALGRPVHQPPEAPPPGKRAPGEKETSG